MNQGQDLSSVQGAQGGGERSSRTGNLGAEVRSSDLSPGGGRRAWNHRGLWEPRAPWLPPPWPQLGAVLMASPGAVQAAHPAVWGQLRDAASDLVTSGDQRP